MLIVFDREKSMVKHYSSVKRGIFSAVVCANEQTGRRFYRLCLEFSGQGASAFAAAKPGQFAQLDLASAPLPPTEEIPENLADSAHRQILLRRPFSFADISVTDDKTSVEIIYCALGPATLRMTTLANGDSVSIIGPLGNGFSVPEAKKTAILVAGGMGAEPLLYLAKVLTADFPEIDVLMLAGAQTKDEFSFAPDRFTGYTMNLQPATDDGSLGFAGLVTDCLAERLDGLKSAVEDVIIYSCGPEAMLAKVAEIANKRKITCQVSMERRMACGIGLCQSCAVECRIPGSNETLYKLCCEDGPVFDSKEVVFNL